MATWIGICSAILSGVCDGSYGAVMKVTQKWEWENIWMMFSVTALALFPLFLAVWSVPDLLAVYREVEAGVLWRTFGFGFGWGIGSVFFGLGLYMLGQSFGYTIMIGIVAVGGSLIPYVGHKSGQRVDIRRDDYLAVDARHDCGCRAVRQSRQAQG
ncbi:MAG: L-rhamnose/proton symporter RhaT [Pirellulales bacterium]